MALPAHSLITMAELKSFLVIQGAEKDDEVERAISRASRRIEQHLDRRLVYRAPAGTASTDVIVSTVVLSNISLTIANQPNSAGRTMKVLVTDPGRSLTGGLLTVTGTVAGVAGVTEVFNLAAGNELHGTKFFTGGVTAVVSALSGHGPDSTIMLVASDGYTEYHNSLGWSELAPIEWPIRQVQEVNEDINGVFGTTTALVQGTTYEVRQGASIKRRIARISGKLDFPFYSGSRVVKIRYSAGHFTSANVPDDIKGVAKRLAALYYNEPVHGVEVRSWAGPAGTGSVFGPAELTDADKDALAPYERAEFERTGERDWDTDAA